MISHLNADKHSPASSARSTKRGLGLASDCGDRKPGATGGHDMEIRKAQEADLPALLDIYNYEVEHGTATFDFIRRR